MSRNITISYILAFAKNTWFWLGIWIFYYLRFTDYAGIGIIETVLIVTTTLAEIPTGAIADLYGKKKTLILCFLLEFVGSVLMAFAPNFPTILISVFIMCLGGALYSGTLDALVYDSLKTDGNEKYFDRVISNIGSISLITPAICSVFGGYLYGLEPRAPFVLNSLGYFVGLVSALFLTEPKIDTIKFSFINYLNQTGKGVSELFKNINIVKVTILLLCIGFVTVISSEMVDSFLSFEFKFGDKQMGILWAVVFVVSAIVSQATPIINKKLGLLNSIFLTGVVMAITLVVSPLVGIVLGGLTIIIRASSQGVFGNLASININQNTVSEYRATTISTFNMIKNVPYVLTAYFVGRISDTFSAKITSAYMGVFLGISILVIWFWINRRSILEKQS